MADKNRTIVYQIISDMLDNPDASGIYPTTKCFDRLEAELDARDADLTAAREELEANNKIRQVLGRAAADNFAKAVEALERLEAAERYKTFALAVLEESRAELADLDGGWLQDKAEECGLLVRTEVAEPCGEWCRCEDFPAECLRYAPEVQVDFDAKG